MSCECDIKIKSEQNAKVWYSRCLWVVYPPSEPTVRYENKLVDCDSKSIVSTYNLMLLLFHEQTHTWCETFSPQLRFAWHRASVESIQWSQIDKLYPYWWRNGCCQQHYSHASKRTQHNGQICRSIEIQLVAFDPKVIRLPNFGTLLVADCIDANANNCSLLTSKLWEQS